MKDFRLDNRDKWVELDGSGRIKVVDGVEGLIYDSSEDEKDRFHSSLKTVVEQVPTQDVLVVIGDLNAKIGNKNAGLERAIGKHACGKMNENLTFW